MKRIGVTGLCLAAALAFAAVAASSAAAAGPEYGQCVAKKKGKYSDAGCTTLAIKGTYEWTPGPPPNCVGVKKHGNYSESKCETLDLKKGKPKGKFEKTACAPECADFTSETGKGVRKSVVPLSVEVTCDASKDEGAITGSKTDVDAVQFTGCETLGQKCDNTATLGEIDTYLLSTELVESGGKVYDKFFGGETNSEGTFSVEYACENVGYFRIQGSIAGEMNPINVMGTSENVVFAAGVEQEQTMEYSTTGAPGSWGDASPFEEIVSARDTSAATLEIRG
jgi:hypothetical protein